MHSFPQSIAEEAIQKPTMTNVCTVLRGVLSSTIRALYPRVTVARGREVWQPGKSGDYSCNVAMVISQVGTGCVYIETQAINTKDMLSPFVYSLLPVHHRRKLFSNVC